MEIPIAKPTSPTRLTSIALIADLLAWILVCQKLISKKDAKPIPSHPKNITNKLSAVTNKSIKPVNNERYDIKRLKWGSPFIYSVEYKWTKDEIPETTINIVVDNESKVKLQFTIINSQLNHWNKKRLQVDPKITVSTKAKSERQKVENIAKVDNKQAPVVPIKRPNKIQLKKLKNGKTRIQKYISYIWKSN